MDVRGGIKDVDQPGIQFYDNNGPKQMWYLTKVKA